MSGYRALTPRVDEKKSGARSIGENRERRSADTSNTYILAARSPVFKPRSDLPHDNEPKDAGQLHPTMQSGPEHVLRR